MKTILRGRWQQQLWLVVWLFLSIGSPASAHKSGDAYLTVSGNSSEAVDLRFVMALKDWDTTEPSLDANNNRELTWAELQAALPRLRARTAQELDVTCGQQLLQLDWQFEGLERRTDGAYTVMRAQSTCSVSARLSYGFRLMSALDPTHRLLVAEQRNGRESVSVLSGEQALNRNPGTDDNAARSGQEAKSGVGVLPSFFGEGVSHLFAGYDHIAFLLALILPLSLQNQAGRLSRPSRHPAAQSARRDPAMGLSELITIVSCFTVGHSATLALAVVGGFSVDSRLVEPLIAISIAVSALMNLGWLRQWHRRWVAIGFGLIHGLGFSSSLQALQTGSSSTFWALAGFNLGVEAGQLLLVLIWCGVTCALDRAKIKRRWLVPAGSWSLFAAGLVLAVQRVAFSS